jgi:hypothetical protein
MKSFIHPLLNSVAAACVILLVCTMYVHFFWLRCGGLDVHAWPDHFLCWYLPEVVSAIVGLVGLVVGFLSGAKSWVVAIFAALIALLAFRIQGDFPFGSGLAYLKNGLLYVVLPAVIGSVISSRVFVWRRENAL